MQVRREKEAFHLLTLFQILYQGTDGNIVLKITFVHILAKFYILILFTVSNLFANIFLVLKFNRKKSTVIISLEKD